MQETIGLPVVDENGLDSQCSFHFGGANYFAFVTVTDGEIGEVEIKQNPGPGPLGCMGPVMFFKDNGADKVIALGIGGRPLMGFAEVKIEILRGVEGTLRQNMEAYVAGKLEKVTGATCGGK